MGEGLRTALRSTWLRQWAVQTAAGILLIPITTALQLAVVPSSSGLTLGALLRTAAVPQVLVWAVAAGFLASALRGSTPRRRAAWSAAIALLAAPAVGVITVLLQGGGFGSVIIGLIQLPLLAVVAAPLLAGCLAGLAVVLDPATGLQRIALVLGGALSALGGTFAAGAALATLTASDAAPLDPRRFLLVAGLSTGVLLVAVVLLALSRSPGWAGLTGIGLAVAVLTLLVAMPTGVRDLFEPEPLPYRAPTGPAGEDCTSDPAPCGG